MAESVALPTLPPSTAPQDRPDEDHRLADVPLQEVVELVRIDLPDDQLEPLLERGVLPGCELCPVRLSPGGDPIVTVDGQLLALRREMASCLCVRRRGRSRGRRRRAGRSCERRNMAGRPCVRRDDTPNH